MNLSENQTAAALDFDEVPTTPPPAPALIKLTESDIVHAKYLEHTGVDILASVLTFLSRPAQASVWIKEKLDMVEVVDAEKEPFYDFIIGKPGVCIIRPEVGDMIESTDKAAMLSGRFGNLFFFVDDIVSIEWKDNDYIITFKTGCHQHTMKLTESAFLGLARHEDRAIFDVDFEVKPDRLSMIVPGLFYVFRKEWLKPLRPVEDIIKK